MSPLMVCVLVCVINAQSELYVENTFTFALVWSIGGEVDSASRAKFDMFLRALARGSAPSKYCIAEGAQVRPWMRWMPEGEDLVKQLAERAAGKTGRDISVTLEHFWQRLGVALWRGNAQPILHCLA